MALPGSGPITAAMINTELMRYPTSTLSLNSSAARTLAGKPSGVIKMSDFYNKTNYWASFSPYWQSGICAGSAGHHYAVTLNRNGTYSVDGIRYDPGPFNIARSGTWHSLGDFNGQVRAEVYDTAAGYATFVQGAYTPLGSTKLVDIYAAPQIAKLQLRIYLLDSFGTEHSSNTDLFIRGSV